VTNPKRSPISLACTQWLQSLLAAGTRIIIPEIVDYEVRRELLRANKLTGLTQLDALSGLLEYLPLSTASMRKAANFGPRRGNEANRLLMTARSTAT